MSACLECGAERVELADGKCGSCWMAESDRLAPAADEVIRREDRRLAVIDAAGDRRSSLTPFTEVIAKPVRWAWRDRIALAKLTALAGRPKIGKGLLYSLLIAAITRGRLEGDLTTPRNVILVTTEDEPGDTLKPRLMAAGADLSRVSIFQMGSREEPVPFRVPQDAAELGLRVAEQRAAAVLIDPLMEFIDGKMDPHKSRDSRHAVAALNLIAREHGCAVVVVIHLNKGVSTDPLLRHEGSAAFTQVVRGGLMLGFDPDDPESEEGNQRVLAVSSSNLAHLAPSLAYRIETAHVDGDTGEPITTARMVPIGESSAASHDLLRGRDDEARADRDEATEFLRAELEEGPRPADDLKRAADKAGIAWRTLQRRRRELGITTSKTGMSGGWVWAFPEGATPKVPNHVPEKVAPSAPSVVHAGSEAPEDALSPEGATFNGNGTFDVPLATREQEAEAERLLSLYEDEEIAP